MEFETEGLSLDGLKILVVEDDVTLRTILFDIVTELGGDCVAFDNAEDALVNLLNSHGDCSLIIADHGVPGSIKGMELLAMAQEKWPSIPAILTSGFRLEISEQNPDNIYLFKPWSLEELISAIRQAISARVIQG
ncbi:MULTISPECIES: response regulator [Pseudomonas]|jgi:DNA-binding NtrC family response regulator|uniref:response regulator n=1 Tax=Pseudomonas TaxID=286 RepID=UPI00086358B9|nr:MULTISPECIES: response regulator [Pseudomonas]MBH3376477.1 response regulator [Pseudomonas juntendi]MBS6040878.1 response regulator [Pseudomonas sp.]MDD1989912.1 response regulator [Pseudomonas putida]MDG9892045.1 response regulator [Pseudomonas juntendi]QOH70616.1 response regulator [Pseudomonas putida]